MKEAGAMKYFLVSQMIFLVSGANCPAQTTSLAPDTYDAYHILVRNRYQDGFVPDSHVGKILAELRAIRAAAPEMAKVHEIGRFDLGKFLVRARGLVPTSLTGEQQKTCCAE
jgi:hypothetical protein